MGKTVYSGPIKQIEAVVNPQSNKIHLFGLTEGGVLVEYSAATGQWTEVDQSDAGFLD